MRNPCTYYKFHLRLSAIVIWILLLCFSLNNTSCKKLNIKRINKITTDAIESTDSIITAKGTIVDISEDGITSYGHCWSTKPNPDIYDNKTDFGNSTETRYFNSTLINLEPYTTYYVRSYLSNKTETIYGKEISFNSSFAEIKITNTHYEIIDNSTVNVSSDITGIYSVNIVDYGHQWSDSSYSFDNKTSFGGLSSSITFSSTLSDLSLTTGYNVRAYVKLGESIFKYGDIITFFIPDLIVETDSFIMVDSTNAILEGEILSIGIYPIIDYGHCWSYTTSNPSINDTRLSLGTTSQAEIFTTTLENMIPGVDYYYRAYAIFENTVRYGSVKHIQN